MSDRAKLILRLALFLGVTALIATALYFAFFRTPPAVIETPDTSVDANGNLIGAGDATDDGTTPDTSTDDDTTTGTGTLPVADVASGGATTTRLLTTTAIVSPTTTVSGALAYYNPGDGHFYTINDNGEATLMSQASFPSAETVTFDKGATTAVIEFPDGSNVVYDFTSATQVTLPSHWEDFSFNDDGSAIASKSIGNDTSNRSLILSSTDGTHTEVVAALGANDSKVDVNMSPSGTVVAFSATGSAQTFDRNEMYLIGTDGDVVGSLIVQGTNFSAIWSPNGLNLLYSVADPSNNYRPALWYADSRGDRHGDVRLHLGPETWVEKCTFASTSIVYCAVPNDVTDGSGDNHSLVDSNDSLYKIDLSTGKATLAGFAAAETQMFNLTVSDDGDTLYFQDDAGRLLSMRLK